MRVCCVLAAVALVGCYSGSEISSDGGADPMPPEATSGLPEPVDPPAENDATSSSTGPAEPDEDDGTSSSTGQPLDPASTSAGEDGSDASTGNPATGCDAVPEALLCDDFDTGIDPDVWTTRSGGGATIDVVDGALTVHIGSVATAHAFVGLASDTILPLPDNHFFGRVMFRLSPVSPSNHNYLFAAWGSLNGTTARYRLDSNIGQLNSRYTHASVEQHGGWRKMGLHAPAEVWTCVEWEFDGTTNSMRFWFDGQLDEEMEVDGATEDPPWVAPIFENFELGYHTYQAVENGDDFEIAYDDLVLDTQRVGCEVGR